MLGFVMNKLHLREVSLAYGGTKRGMLYYEQLKLGETFSTNAFEPFIACKTAGGHDKAFFRHDN